MLTRFYSFNLSRLWSFTKGVVALPFVSFLKAEAAQDFAQDLPIDDETTRVPAGGGIWMAKNSTCGEDMAIRGARMGRLPRGDFFSGRT